VLPAAQALYPVSAVLQSCEAEGAPGPSGSPGGAEVPQLQQVSWEPLSKDVARLQLSLVLPREGMFGAIAFDGPLISWSLGTGNSSPWEGTKVGSVSSSYWYSSNTVNTPFQEAFAN
jgi:hypothetical protein